MSNSGAWGITTEPLIGVPPQKARTVNMNHLGRALTELSDPPISVLFVYNCNPLATVPDQNRVRRGLEREDLFTVVFEQVKTDTCEYADVILPATTFFEHYDIAKGYGAYHLHVVKPVIDAVGEARPNQEVFRDLSLRLGLVEPSDSDELGEPGAFMEITEKLSPDAGQSLRDGALAPAPAGGHPVQFVDIFPNTTDKKAHLFPEKIRTGDPLFHYQPDPATSDFPLSLISPASEHTISSTLGELRPGIAKLRIHPDDAHPRHLNDGDAVRVFNALGEVHCEATVSGDMRPGTVALPKGLWAKSTFNGATSNALVPDSLTDIGGGACFNDARVQVELLGRH
jgi:anaerobic selenocysteine-containing dehydrogenase